MEIEERMRIQKYKCFPRRFDADSTAIKAQHVSIAKRSVCVRIWKKRQFNYVKSDGINPNVLR